MTQTSVTWGAPAIGVAGQLADDWTVNNGAIDPVTSAETTNQIGFGLGVKRGTTDDSALLLTANTDALDGISVFEQDFSKPDQLGATGILPSITFRVCRFGRIVVVPEDGVDPTKGVFVRAVANGGNITIGAFRGTADGSNTIDVSAFGKWRSTATAGNPAVLEINLIGA